MRTLALGLALLVAAGLGGTERKSPATGPPLARLAETVAEEVVRLAGERAVEFAVPDDRYPTRAIDLQALVIARLSGRASVATSGPRLRVVSALSQTATRLVLSGRVLEEPGGRLVDLISASVQADPNVLTLTGTVPAGAGDELVIRDQVHSSPLPDPVVDLAFVGDDRLVALSPNAIAVWRRDGLALRLESRRDFGKPTAPVRRPGGVLAVWEADVWAATSSMPNAVLLALDGGRLRAVDTAQAVPWPPLPRGVRFRPGTNLIEAEVAGLGAGPFLAVEGRDELWLVAGDGRLGRLASGTATWTTARTGPALAMMWPGLLAAASPDPPAASDRVLFLSSTSAGADADVRTVGSAVIDGGSVRALAARRVAHGAVVAAAMEETDGPWRLVLLDVGRERP